VNWSGGVVNCDWEEWTIEDDCLLLKSIDTPICRFHFANQNLNLMFKYVATLAKLCNHQLRHILYVTLELLTTLGKHYQKISPSKIRYFPVNKGGIKEIPNNLKKRRATEQPRNFYSASFFDPWKLSNTNTLLRPNPIHTRSTKPRIYSMHELFIVG
jgi:hypothetical protein